MEKKPPVMMTPFDRMVTNEMLQTMKLMIPYLPPDLQRMAGIYAKFTELQNAIACFQPPYHDSRRRRLRQKKLDMETFTEELAPYLSPDIASSVENLRQAMSMMEMMQSMGDMGDMMQSMANMGNMMQGMGNMGDVMQNMANMGDMMQSMTDMSDIMKNMADTGNMTQGTNTNDMMQGTNRSELTQHNKSVSDTPRNSNIERSDKHERMDEQSASCGSGPGETGTDTDGGQPDKRQKRQEPGPGHDVTDHRGQ